LYNKPLIKKSQKKGRGDPRPFLLKL